MHAGYVVPIHQVVGGEFGVSVSYSIPAKPQQQLVTAEQLLENKY
jgi:hypothetical protein